MKNSRMSLRGATRRSNLVFVVCLLCVCSTGHATPPPALGAVNLERVPAQVSERAWQQYQRLAQRTDEAPAVTTPPTEQPLPVPEQLAPKAPAVPAVEAVPSTPVTAPTPVATTPVTVPQNLSTFAGQLVRVTPETVVIRHHESGEQKILQRSGVLIKDVVVGDEVTVQYAPDREALVTIVKR